MPRFCHICNDPLWVSGPCPYSLLFLYLGETDAGSLPSIRAGEDIDAGYRYGNLGFDMYKMFKAKAWYGRICACYYGCVHGWKKPIQECLEPLRYAHRVSLESGDIEFGMFNANIYCWSQLNVTPLATLDHEIAGFCDRMEFYGQEKSLRQIKPMWQMVHNFMARSERPTVLTGDIIDEFVLDAWRKTDETVYLWSHFYKLVLCYVFGDYAKADKVAQICQPIADYPFGAVDNALVVLMDALTALAQEKQQKARRIAFAEKRLKRLQGWSLHSPLNFLGAKFLVEAEIAALSNDHGVAFQAYTCAIALSRESGFIFQTALSAERACKYFLGRNDATAAKPFFEKALAHYDLWGAKAKVDHLTNELKSAFE